MAMIATLKSVEDRHVSDSYSTASIPLNKLVPWDGNVRKTNAMDDLEELVASIEAHGNVFDELTRYYNGNTSHTEGWKTNDNYKVNTKIVFPYGRQFEAKYGGYFSLRHCYCHSRHIASGNWSV